MPRRQPSSAINFERIAIVTDTADTASNLTGPGRLLGRWLTKPGRRLESVVSRAAQRFGAGPTVLVARILYVDDLKAWEKCRHCKRSVLAAWVRLIPESRASATSGDVFGYLTAFRCSGCRRQCTETLKTSVEFVSGCEKLVDFLRDKNASSRALAACYLTLLLYFHPDLRDLLTKFNTSTILRDLYEESVFWDNTEKMAVVPNLSRALSCMDDARVFEASQYCASLGDLTSDQCDLALQDQELRIPLAFWIICGLKQFGYDIFIPSPTSIKDIWCSLVESGDPLSLHVLRSFLEKLFFSLYDIEADYTAELAWTRLWVPLLDARVFESESIRGLPSFLSELHAVYVAQRVRLLGWNPSLVGKPLDELARGFSTLEMAPDGEKLYRIYGDTDTDVEYPPEWDESVATDVRLAISEIERRRQCMIFKLIQSEKAYIHDLESLEKVYITPLRTTCPPVLPRDLESFIEVAFYRYKDIIVAHNKLLHRLQDMQTTQHHLIDSVTEPVLDCLLNCSRLYLEYGVNLPRAAYRIKEETDNHTSLRSFLAKCLRHPAARGRDIKLHIHRPILRLLRYELLLKAILDHTPDGHDDLVAIPSVLEVLRSLLMEMARGATGAIEQTELWKYNQHLTFQPGHEVDMDLLHESRSLMYAGPLLCPSEGGRGWSEVFVILFDNYLVMTKRREKNGITKYYTTRRPILIDLVTFSSFDDPSVSHPAGLFRSLTTRERVDASPPSSPQGLHDSRIFYPFTIYHDGRMGGLDTLYAASPAIRTEWQEMLDHALALRKALRESTKVFETEVLSADTFLVPSIPVVLNQHRRDSSASFMTKVTCSLPFRTPDLRAMMAIGCPEGVWIGFRHEARSLRQVLHLKMVTQLAILEEFGIFLVLADKCLFAYQIEALVLSSTPRLESAHKPQKLNGTKNVQNFRVGHLQGRTLVVYTEKTGLISNIFCVLEAVSDSISASTSFSLGHRKNIGFHVYREVTLPYEPYDLVFLETDIAILSAKGFEILDLASLESVMTPRMDKPIKGNKPLAIFKLSRRSEYILCYDAFGLYVNSNDGSLTRSKARVAWEGLARHAVWRPPYILLFDSCFIEIRDIESGQLLQIIPGSDVRCVWDGRGSRTRLTPAPLETTEEVGAYAVMNVPEVIRPRGVPQMRAQHIVELIPTAPLGVGFA